MEETTILEWDIFEWENAYVELWRYSMNLHIWVLHYDVIVEWIDKHSLRKLNQTMRPTPAI